MLLPCSLLKIRTDCNSMDTKSFTIRGDNDSKKFATLENLSGMKWKRKAQDHGLPSSLTVRGKSSISGIQSNENYGQRQTNISANTRLEVLVRETYQFEEPDSDEEIDYIHLNYRPKIIPKYFKAYLPLREEQFFRNIHPKNDKAHHFYTPEKIAATLEQERQESLKPKMTGPGHHLNSNCSRKPWLSLPIFKSASTDCYVRQQDQPAQISCQKNFTKVDQTVTEPGQFHVDSNAIISNLNPNAGTFVPESNVTENDGSIDAPVNICTLQYQQEIPKRRPGIRLNRKRVEIIDHADKPVSPYNIFSDGHKSISTDIDKILDQIDAVRLNNLSKNFNQENDLQKTKISDQVHPVKLNRDFNQKDSCQEINITAATFVNMEPDMKPKDVCFSSSSVSTIPTAMVQPSVMTSQRGVIQDNINDKQLNERNLNIVQNSCKLLELSGPLGNYQVPPPYSYTNSEVVPVQNQIHQLCETPINQQISISRNSDTVTHNQNISFTTKLPELPISCQMSVPYSQSQTGEMIQIQDQVSQVPSSENSNITNIPLNSNQMPVLYSYAFKMIQEQNRVSQLPAAVSSSNPAQNQNVYVNLNMMQEDDHISLPPASTPSAVQNQNPMPVIMEGQSCISQAPVTFNNTVSVQPAITTLSVSQLSELLANNQLPILYPDYNTGIGNTLSHMHVPPPSNSQTYQDSIIQGPNTTTNHNNREFLNQDLMPNFTSEPMIREQSVLQTRHCKSSLPTMNDIMMDGRPPEMRRFVYKQNLIRRSRDFDVHQTFYSSSLPAVPSHGILKNSVPAFSDEQIGFASPYEYNVSKTEIVKDCKRVTFKSEVIP